MKSTLFDYQNHVLVKGFIANATIIETYIHQLPVARIGIKEPVIKARKNSDKNSNTWLDGLFVCK